MLHLLRPHPPSSPGNHPSIYSLYHFAFSRGHGHGGNSMGPFRNGRLYLATCPSGSPTCLCGSGAPSFRRTSCIHAPVKDILFASGFWQLLIKHLYGAFCLDRAFRSGGQNFCCISMGLNADIIFIFVRNCQITFRSGWTGLQPSSREGRLPWVSSPAARCSHVKNCDKIRIT